MAHRSDEPRRLLLAAYHLERCAECLPRWSEASQEPWHEFLDRRYETETALIEELRRAPNCRIEVCPRRQRVDLTLGGISVSTDQGLGAVFKAWTRQALGRLGVRGSEAA